MSIISSLAHLPIDLGQGHFMHSTKGKQIAFSYVLRPVSGAPALDVGCGDGYWSEILRKAGYKVTSIDQERTYPNVDSGSRYEQMQPVDINKPLPFPDGSFDLIWCTEVIEHLDRHTLAISEMRRVLKPKGRMIITTPNSFFWLHYLLLLFGLSNKDWQNEGHVNFFSLDDIKKLFPGAAVYGYFPYMLIKAKIAIGIPLLSPTFVVVEEKKG
ncbi:MAG: class I SAM-dependent methyltransferase [bacterium]|nr:class I SAM-dependent methyltransferase [bacterium]